MRKILIVFVAVFVALAAVPAAAQTTGTATVGGVEKRAWNLLSGHVWTDGLDFYINAGCQNIDPQPWGTLTTIVRMDVKIMIGGQTLFYTKRGETQPWNRDVDGRWTLDCNLGEGIDIVQWKLPPFPSGWPNEARLRIHIVSDRNPAHLGVANNASQQWARLYFGNGGNPYPGTGILSQGRVVTEDELYNPGDYER